MSLNMYLDGRLLTTGTTPAALIELSNFTITTGATPSNQIELNFNSLWMKGTTPSRCQELKKELLQTR